MCRREASSQARRDIFTTGTIAQRAHWKRATASLPDLNRAFLRSMLGGAAVPA